MVNSLVVIFVSIFLIFFFSPFCFFLFSPFSLPSPFFVVLTILSRF